MILHVRVTPKSSRNLIKEEKGSLKAYLTKPNQAGLAHAQLIDLLAEHLNVKKYQIRIIRGHKSRDKIIEIDERAGSGVS
jgi:uncharacterized protein YggU (UPF0235/DUF167 family)